MAEIKAQYGRVKGAVWFPLLHKKDILVLGQGGIGSWVSLLLSRIGCNLHIYDMDIYEEHNMTGQIVKKSGIGKKKTEAVKEIIIELSPDCVIDTYGQYEDTSETNDIVICGFDNMRARKLAFTKWVEYVNTDGIDKSTCFFQDGRLNAEQLQIFNIPGNREDLIKEYEKEYLFADEEVEETDCTFKQTSHCAAMIASHMVGFLTNWIYNSSSKSLGRQVPFFYQYLIPLNL
jgi:tRNA A37 threonylcarbamoyladenosine dehydratase